MGGAAGSGERIESVQLLRGVAAMLVVFNHAALLARDAKESSGVGSLVPSRMLTDLGEFGVDLFFVISGFVMALGAHRFAGLRGAVVFLVQRINRIAPLFYLACLVLAAWMLGTGAETNFERAAWLNSLTFIPFFDDTRYSWPIHYLGWTLAFEFVFYLFVFAQIVLRLGAKPLVLLVAVAAAPLFNDVASGERVVWHFFTNPMLWEFALGVTAFVLWDAGLLQRTRWVGSASLVLAFAILAAFAWNTESGWFFLAEDPIHDGDSAARALYWGVPAFLIFCFTVTRAPLGHGRFAAVGRRLGDASYSLYLSHLFVMMVAAKAAQLLPLPPVAVLVIAIVASAVTGVLVYALVEKPLLEVGQRAIRRRTSGWFAGASVAVPFSRRS